MDFGLYVDPAAPIEVAPETQFEGIRDLASSADEAGFDLLSTGQHYVSEYNQLQPIPLLSRLAADVDSMTIATGVLLLPLLQPVDVAEQLSTLSVMADGVIAGVGAGYRDAEFDSFGVPKHERGARMREGVELLNLLWTEDRVTYDGEHYSVEGVSIHPRPERKPPVWIGAHSIDAIERAARIGDAWFVNPTTTVSEVREQKDRYDEIRRESGEDTSVPVFREAFVAPTTEEAVATAREHLVAKYESYFSWEQGGAMEDETELGQAFDDLAEDRFLLGSPEEVCAEIERYEEDLDASHVVLRLNWPGFPYETASESVELVGDEVIPYVG